MKVAPASAAALCATALMVGLSVQSTGAMAQSGGQDKMGHDTMGKTEMKGTSYTGCVQAGEAPRTYVLTRLAAADDHMGKDAMSKDSTSKSAMAPSTLIITSHAVDLSKYVGQKVAVTGTARGEMDAMATNSHAFTIKTVKTLASSCQ
jgi:hypothetical protein